MSRKPSPIENEPDVEVLDSVSATAGAHEVGLARVEAPRFTREQIDLIKDTVARDTTDTEFELFIYTAHRMGLDPLLRQIHAVKRWDSNLGRMAMAVQTGIDGYRLIADRTGKYAPGREPSYVYEDGSKLFSATAYVKKLVAGTWHEVPATAHYAEYVGLKKDGKPNSMWAGKPHIMLAKCAEAIALRRAFPAEMAGVYTKEEMPEADDDEVTRARPAQQSSNRPADGAQSRTTTAARGPVPPRAHIEPPEFVSPEHKAAMDLGDVNAPLREYLGKQEAKKPAPVDGTLDIWDDWLEQNTAAGMLEDLTATHLRILLTNKSIQEAEKALAKQYILSAKNTQEAAAKMVDRLKQVAAEREYVEMDKDLDDAVGAAPKARRVWKKMSGGAR